MRTHAKAHPGAALWPPASAGAVPDPPPRRLRAAWELVRDAAAAWSDDYASSMGAALAYYTLFSLGPVVLIVISVAGLIFGADAARGEILVQLRGLVGQGGAVAIESLLRSIETNNQGAFGTVVGVALLAIGATTVFGELQDALDRIWRSPARQHSAGWWSLLRSRLLSFGFILALVFLLMVSLVASAGLAALSRLWAPALAPWPAVAEVANTLVSFVLTVGLFAFIYKFLPQVRIAWRDVLVGALVTAVLFNAGKLLIGLYIGHSGVASGFGAASSIVVLIVWVYYSAQIFLAGAEFTWVYAHRYGSRRGTRSGAQAVQDGRPRPSRSGTASTV